MTFKIKSGIQIGANLAIDEAALLQQIELNPSVRPSVLFDFAKSKTVDARATFTRATTATYVDEDGYIKTALSNEPRFEYSSNGAGIARGLCIEAYRDNLISSSDYFYNTTYWSPVNVTVAPNVGTAPDGSFTATKVWDSVDTVGTFHNLNSSGSTIVNGSVYTFSIFAKASELTRIAVYPINGSNGSQFDLTTGSVISVDTGVTSSIEPYKDGWFRCMTTIAASANGTATPRVYLLNTGTNYTGDGAKGLYIWGAQFEVSSMVTSYFPTTVSGFTRSSTATYRDNYDGGYLKTASINNIRLNYNPITRVNTTPLLEPAATNLVTNSENVAAWTQSFVTTTNNNATSPFSTLTAARVTEDTTTNRHYVAPASVSITANTIATGSVFLKAGTRTRAYVWVGQPGSPFTRAGVVIDLTTGTTTVSNVNTPAYGGSMVEDWGDGWYRVSVFCRPSDGITSTYMEIGGADNSNATTYLGNGSYFYVWGGQIENTRFPTSYIPTTAAAVTRAADAYTITSSWRNTDVLAMPASSAKMRPYEGTILFEGELCGNAAPNQYICSLGDGTVESLISIRHISNTVQFVVYNKGSSQGSIVLQDPYVANTPYKTAIAFSNTGWYASHNGVPIAGVYGPGIGVPPYGSITIGSGFNSVNRAYIKNFAYYPAKLSNTELTTITSS